MKQHICSARSICFTYSYFPLLHLMSLTCSLHLCLNCQFQVVRFQWQLMISWWWSCGFVHHYTVPKPKWRPAAFQPGCLTCFTTAFTPWLYIIFLTWYVFIIGFALHVVLLLTQYAIVRVVFFNVSVTIHMCLLKCASLILFLLPVTDVLVSLNLCLPIEVFIIIITVCFSCSILFPYW
jgi:hypothetical protein